MLASTHRVAWLNPLNDEYLNPAALDQAIKLARTAIELNPSLSEAYAELGYNIIRKRDFDAPCAHGPGGEADVEVRDRASRLGALGAQELARRVDRAEGGLVLLDEREERREPLRRGRRPPAVVDPELARALPAPRIDPPGRRLKRRPPPERPRRGGSRAGRIWRRAGDRST